MSQFWNIVIVVEERFVDYNNHFIASYNLLSFLTNNSVLLASVLI
jgi:hypothetical protein